MRALLFTLLVMPVLLPAGASAQPTLNKCIDAEGRITYSNLPCRNAREMRKVEIDPAPPADAVRAAPPRQLPANIPPAAAQPAKRDAPRPGLVIEPSSKFQIEPPQEAGKAPQHASAAECDALADKLGQVLDKMDQARRRGFTKAQMDDWNQEIQTLEQQKQQSGCF